MVKEISSQVKQYVALLHRVIKSTNSQKDLSPYILYNLIFFWYKSIEKCKKEISRVTSLIDAVFAKAEDDYFMMKLNRGSVMYKHASVG